MAVNLSTIRLGILDLGTVALRFDVYRFSVSGDPILSSKYRSMPRLGEVNRDFAALSARVLPELRKISELAAREGVTEMIAVGTMALREAPGVERLLKEAEETLGIRLRVVSGEEEAMLTARGILSQERDLPESVALVDIGGGSTEVSFCNNGRRLESRSFAAGVLRIGPIDDASRIRALLKEQFAVLSEASLRYRPSVAIGSSGTVRAIERLLPGKPTEDAQRRVFAKRELEKIFRYLLPLSPEELLQVPGVERLRADILVPGLLIFDTVLEILSLDKFRVSHYSLRHGLLAEWMEKVSVHGSSMPSLE